MILSLAHKFVFVKGRKVAGTSIEMALAAICGPDDIVAPILAVDERERLRAGAACRNYAADPVFERAYLAMLEDAAPEALVSLRPPRQIYYNHMPLSEIERLYARPLDDFRIVCAERSPYAKVISWLNMEAGIRSYRIGGDMGGKVDGLRAAFDSARRRGRIAAAKNIDLYKDRTGAFRADVLRYETLRDDFETLLGRLGCRPVPLPHAKKGLMSDRLDPRDVFRRDQIDEINVVYDAEFDRFGYQRV
jgi:hypothetical protein